VQRCSYGIVTPTRYTGCSSAQLEPTSSIHCVILSFLLMLLLCMLRSTETVSCAIWTCQWCKGHCISSNVEQTTLASTGISHVWAKPMNSVERLHSCLARKALLCTPLQYQSRIHSYLDHRTVGDHDSTTILIVEGPVCAQRSMGVQASRYRRRLLELDTLAYLTTMKRAPQAFAACIGLLHLLEQTPHASVAFRTLPRKGSCSSYVLGEFLERFEADH
jgi:hypothetical protein